MRKWLRVLISMVVCTSAAQATTSTRRQKNFSKIEYVLTCTWRNDLNRPFRATGVDQDEVSAIAMSECTKNTVEEYLCYNEGCI